MRIVGAADQPGHVHFTCVVCRVEPMVVVSTWHFNYTDGYEVDLYIQMIYYYHFITRLATHQIHNTSTILVHNY